MAKNDKNVKLDENTQVIPSQEDEKTQVIPSQEDEKTQVNTNVANQINDVINTTKSIKTSGMPDAKLQSEQLKRAQVVVNSPRKKFKCSSIYARLYPDGFISTYQGIVINLIFDNRTVELPEPIYYYVMNKMQKKADSEAEKVYKFKNKKQEKIGEYFEG